MFYGKKWMYVEETQLIPRNSREGKKPVYLSTRINNNNNNNNNSLPGAHLLQETRLLLLSVAQYLSSLH